MSDDTPEFYTTAEVADLFRVERRTVIRWIRDGKLRAVRTPSPGGQGHYRVPADAVQVDTIPVVTTNATDTHGNPVPSWVTVAPTTPRCGVQTYWYDSSTGGQVAETCREPATRIMEALDGSRHHACIEHSRGMVAAGAREVPTDG